MKPPKSSKIIAFYNFAYQNRQLDFDQNHTDPWFVIEPLEIMQLQWPDHLPQNNNASLSLIAMYSHTFHSAMF